MKWKNVPLSSVAEIVMGNAPSSAVVNTEEDGMPFLQGSRTFGFKFPTFNSWCSAPKKLARRGDILMSVRAPVGDTNIADREYCIGRGLCAIRAFKADQDYLRYAVSFAVKSLEAVSQGSTIDAVNKSNIEQMLIPLPPLPVQRWIADALASVDEWIEMSSEVLQLANVLTYKVAEETMKEGRFSENSVLYALIDCCKNVKVGIATSTTRHYASRSDGVPMILNRSIKMNSIDRDSLEFISKEYDRINIRKRLMPGDVVVTRTGNPGLAAVVPEDMRGWQAFTTLILTPKSEIIRSDYLSEWINSVHGQAFVKQGQAGGAQKNLNAGEIEKMPVRLPDLGAQEAIVNAISESRTYEKLVLAEIKYATMVKKYLFHQLLSGTFQPAGGWAVVIPELVPAAAT